MSRKPRSPLFKTVSWFILNGGFCLLPLMIILFFDMMPVNSEINHLTKKELQHFLRDGLLVFFFCAIMGAIWVDIVLSDGEIIIELNNYVGIRWLTTFVIVWLPLLFLSGLTTIYLLIVYENMKEDYFEKLTWFPKVLIGFSFVYCFSYKLYNFIQEED